MPSYNRPSTARPSSQGRGHRAAFDRPETATSNYSRNAETNASDTGMNIQGFSMRPVSALTRNNSKAVGLNFYKCPKSGSLAVTNPKYTIPK
jgi:hypothetical protein